MSQRSELSSSGTKAAPKASPSSAGSAGEARRSSGASGDATPQTGPTPRAASEQSGADVTDEVRKTAAHLASSATAFVGNRLTAQKARATTGLGAVADAIRKTGGSLAENESVDIRPYLEAAAERVDRFSAYLNDREIGDVVEDLEALARRRPVVFFGGAFALGFLIARFVRSSDSYSGRGNARRAAERV